MTPPLRAAALCAGYGGLEMGLQLAGLDIELDWYSEIDKNASKVMTHHWPDATNLGDLTQIADPPQVDIMTAGFPCQPFSQAGKRAGVNDERWLIDDVTDLARRSGVRWLLLENVRGLLSANDGDAMARVCAALARNGFDAEWTTVRASDVGAPHRRERWFCLAWPTADASGIRRFGRPPCEEPGMEWPYSEETVGGQSVNQSQGITGPTADADNLGLQRCRAARDGRPRPADGNATDFGPYAAAVERWGQAVGRPAPPPITAAHPNSKGSQRRIYEREYPGRAGNRHAAPSDTAIGAARLNPRFVEWMMGLPEGDVTDVIDKRGPALKMLGNGVVPQQAALAIRMLIDQADSQV